MGFDPITLTALAVGGSVLGAAGKLQQGQAAADAANYQAQVYENNKTIALQNSDWALQAGTSKEVAQDMRGRATGATLKARQAAGGVDVNTGSSKQVQDAQGALASLDALTIRSNTAREAYGYEVEATSDEAKSQLSKMEASNAQTAGEIGAASSLLSGISSAGGRYAKWQNVGDAA